MTSPDQIRREIERTQDDLRQDVDALGQKVSPSRIAERRVNAVRGAFGTAKEKIMGTASSGGSSVKDAAATVGERAAAMAEGVGSAASNAGDAISGAPGAAREHAAGNPLAAGLVAFGAGWLVASLLPASQREREAAAAVQDKAGERLQPALRNAGQELAENLREPAQQAVEAVRSTAGEAASTVQEQASSATGEVTDRARQASQEVRDQRG